MSSIAEYNARFLPPIRFVMPYDDAQSWKHDDSYGATSPTAPN